MSLSNCIIKRMKEEGIDTSQKKTQRMTYYVTEKARQYLKGKDGYIDPNIVFGWARHFYEESETVINNELKDMGKAGVSSVKEENNLVKQSKKEEADKQKQDKNQLSLNL